MSKWESETEMAGSTGSFAPDPMHGTEILGQNEFNPILQVCGLVQIENMSPVSLRCVSDGERALSAPVG